MNDGSTPLAAEWPLIQGVLSGDPAALDTWYRSEHPLVWRLALGVLLRAEEAEDLAQEAMLKLHDKLDRWDPKRPYKQWRNTLVLNLCRDRLRRTGARERAESAAAQDALQQPLPDPSQQLEQIELRRLLGMALGQLSAREREAFVLRELEGNSSEHVAEVMGIEVSSMRSLLTLARRRMREFLGVRALEFMGEDHV
ncbi:MAG: RNA polymerase sigma-70 factor (ECF subfamily) [Planctomycetota bacterium]|jgi:RNA polymerase sigma-70 factor (ECF subfamily)